MDGDNLVPRARRDPVNIMMHALEFDRYSYAAAAIFGCGRGAGDGGDSGGCGEPPPKLEDTHPSHRHNDGATGYGIYQKHSLKL